MPYLKSLHLKYASLDESILERITSSCKEIEDLKLYWCKFNDKLDFIISPKLKRFLYSRSSGHNIIVQVEAPNLERLTYRNGWCALSLSTSHNLIRLKMFQPFKIPDEFISDFEYKFPNLEVLKIQYYKFRFSRIRISSTSLRNMFLDIYIYIYRGNYLEELELHIDAPGVTRFVYGGYSPKVSFVRVFVVRI